MDRRVRRTRHPSRRDRRDQQLPAQSPQCISCGHPRVSLAPYSLFTEMTDYQFPDDFLWGAATSAYQIEGSPTADGAGRSIWHRFSHTPGNTWLDETGDVARDHHRRYKDDVGIMSELGLNAYRFSIAWGRIYPEGTGRINKMGIDFYSRLVDELLKKGIKPNATLYHWDLPEALDDRGGWLNRAIAEWFSDYAGTMFEALGDRVDMWATINEPWVVTDG